MRIAIFSDLHLEMHPPGGPNPQLPYPDTAHVDVIVLAGDIRSPWPGANAMSWVAASFPGRTIVYVPGNHEYYERRMAEQEARLRLAAEATGVHFLQRDSIVVDGVRFLGCTLWTDMRLPVRDAQTGALKRDPERAAVELDRKMTDFHCIRLGPGKNFAPADMLKVHREHRAWLASALAEPFDGPTVIVTHHAPHEHSIPPERKLKWTSTGYASQLPRSFFKVPKLWIHGHVHTSQDYRVGRCRVVCNPRGYPLPLAAQEGAFQNRAWCPLGYVVEV